MSLLPKEFKKLISDNDWVGRPSKARALWCYLRNRFLDKPHLVDTRLEPGISYDVDTRLIHGMFELLVDFVEDECANMYNICFLNGDCPGRSAINGISYLLARDEYSDADQIARHREVVDLYDWWKSRDSRIDPYCIHDPKEVWRLIEAHHTEDTEMLIRLVKIRDSLWT